MIDSHNRTMKKLRVSLLDACDLRCIYCMPEDAVFSSKNERLSYLKLADIIEKLVKLGIDEIRLTGGEPTLSPDFMNLVRAINHLPLKKLALTTNGLRFKKYVTELANTNLNSINFSLDTLRPERFKNITKVDALDKVLESIELAKAYGMSVKINTVVMNNVNSDEILDFVKFSEQHNIPVRFLEAMNIGVVTPHFDRWFISADEMIQEIQTQYQMKLIHSPADSTSFNYELNNGAQIGFIASESKPFCGGCSRLRLDAKGIVHPCLFKNDGISLVDVPLEQYAELLPALIAKKPINRIINQETPMNILGG